MDANFHSLPPLKRFRLLQQEIEKQQQQLPQFEPESQSNLKLKNPKPLQLSPSNLPAKKRKQSRDLFFDPNEGKENLPPTPYCLPAKKRVWAYKPDFSPIKTTSSPPFDLNIEYNPSLELEDKPTQIEIKSKGEEIEVDDDGILCAVCESTDGDASDPIVFCDGCDLMVHSTCYGNPLIKGIPEGEWYCHQCLNSQPSPEKCCLCPDSSGALKPTKDGRWAHIVCAVLVPEVFFEDPEGRDGIDCSKIPKRRWREKCYVCKDRKGCAIECSELNCGLAFHVTCGLRQDLSIELKQGKKNHGGIVAGFCKKHTELWKKQQQTGKFKIVARDEDN
ncbi:Bromodomain and PHD finger-containing protein 3 [Bienertia sinuspersici]